MLYCCITPRYLWVFLDLSELWRLTLLESLWIWTPLNHRYSCNYTKLHPLHGFVSLRRSQIYFMNIQHRLPHHDRYLFSAYLPVRHKVLIGRSSLILGSNIQTGSYKESSMCSFMYFRNFRIMILKQNMEFARPSRIWHWSRFMR